jgi:hypothetical protein
VSPVLRRAIGRRRQISVKPPHDHVAGANIVMCWKIEMRQKRMRHRALAVARIERRKLSRDAVGP